MEMLTLGESDTEHEAFCHQQEFRHLLGKQ